MLVRLTGIRVEKIDLSYIERMLLTELLNELLSDRTTHRLFNRGVKDSGSAETHFRNSSTQLKINLIDKLKIKLLV